MKNVLAALFAALCSCHAPDSEQTLQTAHFRLIAEPGTRAHAALAEAGARLERTEGELAGRLGVQASLPLTVRFVPDRATLARYTGYAASGYTDTDSGKIYFVDKAPLRLAYRHELMHALSWHYWGRPRHYWISEGLAVWATGHCSGQDLRGLCATLAQEGKLSDWNTLTDHFDFRALEPSLQGAAMVRFLHERWGLAAVKAFWQEGWTAAPRSTGMQPEALQAEWLRWAKAASPAPLDRARIRTEGCGD